MKSFRRVLSMFLLSALLLCVCAGCGNESPTQMFADYLAKVGFSPSMDQQALLDLAEHFCPGIASQLSYYNSAAGDCFVASSEAVDLQNIYLEKRDSIVRSNTLTLRTGSNAELPYYVDFGSSLQTALRRWGLLNAYMQARKSDEIPLVIKMEGENGQAFRLTDYRIEDGYCAASLLARAPVVLEYEQSEERTRTDGRVCSAVCRLEICFSSDGLGCIIFSSKETVFSAK
ncbi:MAG: hypothetical protein KH354_04000 [Clostridiales bacterium]|nr:hypothetical protein [Clostridiales bacterium]